MARDVYDIIDEMMESYNGGFTMNEVDERPIRPYQSLCHEAILENLHRDNCRRQQVAMATGAGKTFTFSKTPELLNANRVLILAHREELIWQSALTCAQSNPGKKVGVEQAQFHADGDCDIVVASVPTIGPKKNLKRLEKYGARHFDLIHVDESHHSTSATFLNTLRYFRVGEEDGPVTIGWSATPSRMKGDPLANVFDRIVFERSMKQLIEEGDNDPIYGPYLCHVKARRVRTAVDISDIATRAGDFNIRQLSERINIDPRASKFISAVEDWASDRRSILYYCVDREHAECFLGQLKDRGHSADMVLGNTPKPQRRESVRRFASGETREMVSVGVFTEGTDIPRIDCVVFMAPTLSANKYIQALGRGARCFPGKKDLLVLDGVDNVGRHRIRTANEVFGTRDFDLLGLEEREVKALVLKADQAGVEIVPDDDADSIERKIDQANKLATGTIYVKTEVEAVDVFRNHGIATSEHYNTELPWVKTKQTQYGLKGLRGKFAFLDQRPDQSWRLSYNGQNHILPESPKVPFKDADKIIKKAMGYWDTGRGYAFPLWKKLKLNTKKNLGPPSPEQIHQLKLAGISVLPHDITMGNAEYMLSNIAVRRIASRQT